MTKRDDPVEEPFLRSLQRGITGFRKETLEVQHRLAVLIWNIYSKRREHKIFPTQAFFSYQELYGKFGRDGFNKINGRLKIFDVPKQWSKKLHYGKPYSLTPEVRRIRTTYLNRSRKESSKLVLEDGSYLRTPPKALASKDMDGFTKTGFKDIKLRTCVPVDIQELKNLRKNLRTRKKQIEAGYWRGDLFFQEIAPESIQRYIDEINQVLIKANTQVCGPGRVMHRYIQSKAGRLYAKGINLQTAKGTIKEVALDGLWEYDFENCHYSIFHQLTERAGIECPHIKDYLKRKTTIRKQIAKEVQISEESAKECLIAIMYGARDSLWHENAIPRTVGEEAAKRLSNNPLFKHIYAEIQSGRKAILEWWQNTGRTTYMNAMGKRIKKEETDEKILAHLIQGIEAKMLNIVLDLYSERILLLQHDGFAADEQLDKKRITKKINEDTGFDMKLSEEKIQVGEEIIFSKT